MGDARLYVGGLSGKVDEASLKDQFSKYGRVSSIDLKDKKDPEGNILTRFAYININISQDQISRCIDVLNGTSWLGSRIKVEQARESFIERLKRERTASNRNRESKCSFNNNTAVKKNLSTEEYNLKLQQFKEKFKSSHTKSPDDYQHSSSRPTKSKTKRKRSNSSSSDEDVKQGIMKFQGTGVCNTEDSGHSDDNSNHRNIKRHKHSKLNDKEEEMMVDFKKYSNVWGDSDDENRKDMGIFIDFNSVDKKGKKEIEKKVVESSSEESDSSESEKELEQEKHDQLKSISNIVHKVIIPSETQESSISESRPKSDSSENNSENITENTKSNKYVKVISDLNFQEKTSGFSFLQQFSNNKNDLNDDNKDEHLLDTRYTETKVVPNREIKSRKFFIGKDDPMIIDGGQWMAQELKESIREFFAESRPEIIEVCRTKVLRIKQMGSKKSRKPENNKWRRK